MSTRIHYAGALAIVAGFAAVLYASALAGLVLVALGLAAMGATADRVGA